MRRRRAARKSRLPNLERWVGADLAPGYVAAARGGTTWRVKLSLRDGQILRLLCIGRESNLFPVGPVQSTENAHDKRNSHHPGRAGASCHHCDGSFRTCFPVCAAGLARNAGSLNLSWAAVVTGSGMIPCGRGRGAVSYPAQFKAESSGPGAAYMLRIRSSSPALIGFVR